MLLTTLLKNKVDPNLRRWSYCSLFCSSRGYADIVELLLQIEGIDLNGLHNGTSLLLVAAIRGHLNVIRTLLEKKLLELTPAWIAAEKNHSQVIEVLAEFNADLNSAEKEIGFMPAHQAVCSGNLRAIEALIAAKADIDSPDNNEYTPIFLAAEEGHVSIVKALAKAGANLNRQINGGKTLIYPAANNNHAQIIKVLAEAQVDLNTPKKRLGKTPAHIAAERGNFEAVKA